jgi:hypothetical protein
MKYLLVNDGKREYLLKLDGKTAAQVAVSRERAALYEALLADLGVDLFPAHATGATMFAKPEPLMAAPEPDAGDRRHPCLKCSTPKVKDGKMSDGRQRWRCLTCWPRTGESKQTKSRRQGGRNFHKNPKCDRCHKPMNVRGRHKENTYYKCRHCPPLPRGQGRSSLTLDGDQLEKFVRAKVTKANGHDPQIRDDVVQEIVKDVLEKKLVPRELDTETIRRYIRSQSRLSQNKHREVSTDARVSPDSTVTVGETLEG